MTNLADNFCQNWSHGGLILAREDQLWHKSGARNQFWHVILPKSVWLDLFFINLSNLKLSLKCTHALLYNLHSSFTVQFELGIYFISTTGSRKAQLQKQLYHIVRYCKFTFSIWYVTSHRDFCFTKRCLRKNFSVLWIKLFDLYPPWYRAAAWIGYYWLLSDIIGYFLYSFKIYELPDGKNVWK